MAKTALTGHDLRHRRRPADHLGLPEPGAEGNLVDYPVGFDANKYSVAHIVAQNIM
jgi:hypothetical protein